MTEKEWLACDDLQLLLPFVPKKWSERKGHLYMAASLRAILHLLYSEYSRNVITILEAENGSSEKDVDYVIHMAEVPTFGYDFDKEGIPQEAKSWLLKQGVYTRASLRKTGETRLLIRRRLVNAAHLAYHAYHFFRNEELTSGSWFQHHLGHVASEKDWPGPWLVHEVLGSPFRPVSFDPAWRTTTVTGIAQATYEERNLPSGELDLIRLAILADSLEDSGCTDQQILSHLRGPGPHVRGCFVVDAVLGRT